MEEYSEEDSVYCTDDRDGTSPADHLTIGRETKSSYLFFKRVFDVVLALIALIVLSPLMLMVAIAIKLDSPGPAIFMQNRVGKDGKEFVFYKFRSMREDAEKEKEMLSELNEKGDIVFKIRDDPRVTRVGKFIRRTSIDELPQLINILKSEMSIVGPRPPLPKEVEKYSDYQRQRINVKGGLTCYWQIGGRSNIGFDEWVDLDIKYIKERSMLVDINILLKTFKVVLKREGAV